MAMKLHWSEPIASVIAIAIRLDESPRCIVVFYVAWWIHLLIILTFLVYIPQSKHAHLIAGPVNVYLNRLIKPGN